MIDLKNKRILITGASSGIGRALAFGLAEKGAELILTARKFGKLRIVADMIKYKYPDVPKPLIILCDLTEKKDIKQLFKECSIQNKKIDILVNNAGIGVYGEIELTDIDDFKDIMEVNYFGAVQCMLELLPSMKERKSGIIVNVCSLAAIHGVPYLGAYSASKAALMALSQSMNAELYKFGISITVVYPGYTETSFFSNEKKVGKAVRPEGPYAPADKVAREIIHSIENKKEERILTFKGKALSVIKALFPGIVRRAMRKIAIDLITKN